MGKSVQEAQFFSRIRGGVYRCSVENDGKKCYRKSIFITEKVILHIVDN